MVQVTLPETNIFVLKMDGLEDEIPFWEDLLSGANLSFWELVFLSFGGFRSLFYGAFGTVFQLLGVAKTPAVR